MKIKGTSLKRDPHSKALHATDILYDKHEDKIKFLNKNWTYLFEIIYPSNRIVLDYGKTDDIILLAVIDNETGEEYDIYDDRVNPGFRPVQEHEEFDGKTFRQLQKMNVNNEEGYVLRYENGFRVKVKFKEYVRLHALITNVTPKRIWENLMNGDSLEELIDSIPDESFDWIKDEISRLKKEYNDTEVLAINTYNKLEEELFGTPFRVHRKRFAQTVFENKETARIAHVLFAMLDGKEHSKIIWSLLKPEDENAETIRKTN